MQTGKTELDWNKFKPLFGTWADKIQPFFMSGGFDPIYKFLKFEANRNKKIAPNSNLTYRCFTETPIDKCSVILAGFCPYHTFINNNSIPIADGLCMGCSVTGKLQPSLQYFYEGIEAELYDGMKLDYVKNPDVSYLAKQGVLMYNVALTTEHGKVGNHLDIWDPFAKYFFQEVVGYSGIPIIFLGKEAGKCDKYVTPFTHTFHLTHPAYAARMNTTWETDDCFKKVNKIIKENNNQVIDWLDSTPF